MVLVGDKDHPEVKGTAGWCKGEVYVVSSREDVQALPPMKKAMIASQTTLQAEKWEELIPCLHEKIETPV